MDVLLPFSLSYRGTAPSQHWYSLKWVYQFRQIGFVCVYVGCTYSYILYSSMSTIPRIRLAVYVPSWFDADFHRPLDSQVPWNSSSMGSTCLPDFGRFPHPAPVIPIARRRSCNSGDLIGILWLQRDPKVHYSPFVSGLNQLGSQPLLGHHKFTFQFKTVQPSNHCKTKKTSQNWVSLYPYL